MQITQTSPILKCLRRFTPFFIVLLLFGCETTPPLPTHSVEYQSHQAKLTKLSHFTLSGKLGYIDPTQRQSLNFHWKQTPQQSQLRLSTFLGKTVLNLNINEQGATVTDIHGKRYFDKDADLLFYQLTGMRLPIVYMQDWIKGQPTAADDFQVSENGTLASLEQTRGGQTWLMDYKSYQETETLLLPNKMTLSRQPIKLNIVISKWDIQ
ncbi:lipoprotein insertase outer membrane protein LolB [Vibrio ezurae]|uniref:Outer-membrane lipoprotein LolB n=1 Tax=Vibrio ezurae NBRC 102218 TaxID=1219080 RepID=U3CGE2_9VIBR|nr:lipoprotein insertase outer membrane protein LolB [Vibrio ezurae]GAD80289.1 outer-membrane lipoprotein LolB [Vibrio ezurae NBRC 102218]